MTTKLYPFSINGITISYSYECEFCGFQNDISHTHKTSKCVECDKINKLKFIE